MAVVVVMMIMMMMRRRRQICLKCATWICQRSSGDGDDDGEGGHGDDDNGSNMKLSQLCDERVTTWTTWTS